MLRTVGRIVILSIFLIMYVSLEVSLFEMLGWQGGVVVTLLMALFVTPALIGPVLAPLYGKMDDVNYQVDLG